jgi:predicted deacylase
MLPERPSSSAAVAPVRANTTTWVRAPVSGIVSTKCRLGERVKSGQPLGAVSDPFSEMSRQVLAPTSGVVIGRSTSPLSHEGDALFHLARFEDNKEAKAMVDEFQEVHSVPSTWG